MKQNNIRLDHAIIQQITEEEMQEVYNWVDEIPLSRPKKNIARDFSDCGKLMSKGNVYTYYVIAKIPVERVLEGLEDSGADSKTVIKMHYEKYE